MLGPAEHFPLVVYFILGIGLRAVIAIVVVAVGRRAAAGAAAVVTTAAKQVIAVADADVVAELIKDGIKALAFTLLKRSTLGHQARY